MPAYSTLLTTLYWAVSACLIYFVCVNAYYLILLTISSFENRLRVQQDHDEDSPEISCSGHTLPVSVVIAAYNEERTIKSCLR